MASPGWKSGCVPSRVAQELKKDPLVAVRANWTRAGPLFTAKGETARRVTESAVCETDTVPPGPGTVPTSAMSPLISGRLTKVVVGTLTLLPAAAAAPATAAPASRTPRPTATFVPISNWPTSPTVPRVLNPGGTRCVFAVAGGSTTMALAVATESDGLPAQPRGWSATEVTYSGVRAVRVSSPVASM